MNALSLLDYCSFRSRRAQATLERAQCATPRWENAKALLAPGGGRALRPLPKAPDMTRRASRSTTRAALVLAGVTFACAVYWIDADAAKVMRVSRAGGPIESLASTQGDPSAIAVDDRAVYWSTYEGKVFTLPRR